MPTILLIDDDDQVRMLFQVALAGTGYRVLIVENGKHGLRLLEHQEVDLALVDMFLPDMGSLEVRTPASEPPRRQDHCHVRRLDRA